MLQDYNFIREAYFGHTYPFCLLFGSSFKDIREVNRSMLFAYNNSNCMYKAVGVCQKFDFVLGLLPMRIKKLGFAFLKTEFCFVLEFICLQGQAVQS